MKFENSWKRYEAQVDKLLAFYLSLSEAQLNFSIHHSAWNLFQVMEHLYHVEYVTFKAVQERAATGIKKKSTFKHQKKYCLLAFALLLPSKYKAPKALVNSEKPRISGDFILSWKSHNARLKEFIFSLPSADKEALLFKHPIAGPFNVKQTLGFLYYHLKHHKYQLDAIKKSSDFPLY
jgi:hypothetical protein